NIGSATTRLEVRVESEVVQCSEANGVGICIGRERFRAPCDRVVADAYCNIPRGAAVSSIVLCAIVRETRMLGRRMESNVIRRRNKKRKNDFKGLDSAIQVLIVDGVLVVPHSGSGTGHFITNEEDAIISRIWLDLGHRRACPSHDGWLLSDRAAHGIKSEGLANPGYCVLFIGSVVIHVALVGMTLAPGAFVRDDVFRFGKIGRSRI